MSWYKLRLTKEQIEKGVLAALQNEFRRLWHLVGEPKDIGLFADSKYEQRNSQRFFISPGSLPWAESILSHYFASPCNPPEETKVRLQLLVGHMEAEGLID